MTRELQHGIELPILPCARRVLGLAFDGDVFSHSLSWSGRSFTLRAFALLHYDAEQMRERVGERPPADVPEDEDLLIAQPQPMEG